MKKVTALGDQELQDLEQITTLSSDEWSETVSALLALRAYSPYISERLQKAVDKELLDNYNWARSNLRIVKRVDTDPRVWMEVVGVGEALDSSDEIVW